MKLHHMMPGKFLRLGPCLIACLLVLLVLLRPAPGQAQSANDGFDPGPNGTVYDVATQADGRILVAGQFSSIAGTNRNYLARLNVDGSFDTQFRPTVGAFPGNDIGRAVAVAVQADGKILVGGQVIFADTTTGGPGGYVIAGVGRLHPDGTTDTNFIPRLAPGPFGGAWSVWHIAAQPDGKVVIAGDFTTSAGGINPASATARTNLARLNPDGTVDASFDPRNTGSIYNLLLQRDGKILVAGLFTSLGGHAITNLARFNPDGSFDETFQPDIGGAVLGLGQQADGKIIAGGSFTVPGSPSHTNLIRLNPNSTTDETFQPALGGSGFRVTVQPDGKILVGGTFTSLNGQARTNLARLLPDGTLDTTFNPGANGMVRTLAMQGDGKILVGGQFNSVGAFNRTNLARLYADGSLDATMNIGANSQPSAITPLPDESMILGGNFRTVGGKARSRIAKIRPDGSVDDLFISDVAPQAFNIGSFVRTVLLQTDGRILIGGNLSNVAGTTFTNLARVNPDGSADGSFKPYSSMFSSIAIQRDGKILTGTDGSGIGPVYEKSVRRHNSDGTPDPSFNTALQTPPVYTVAVREDGKVLAGGSFRYTNGQNLALTSLALFNTNGTFDASFAISVQGPISGVQAVNALLMQPDGSVLIGGNYERLGNYTCNGLGRVRADGSVDTNFIFAGVSGEIVGLALQADGRILVGGSFSFLGVPARSNLLRLNPDGSIDATFDAGVNGMVRGLSIGADGKVWLGGSFSTVAGIARTNLARLSQRDAAIQSLAMDGESITWTRTGTAPEVQEVTFEQSMDGTGFAMLGYAARMTNGWRLDGLSLPVGQNFFIRARGRSISGRYSGSSGLIESVAQFWRLPPPFLNNVQVLGDGQFQFSFTNTNATAFSVLASTNAAAPLAQWESLGAPVSVGGGIYQFTDAGATNHAHRFYQLRSP